MQAGCAILLQGLSASMTAEPRSPDSAHGAAAAILNNADLSARSIYSFLERAAWQCDKQLCRCSSLYLLQCVRKICLRKALSEEEIRVLANGL